MKAQQLKYAIPSIFTLCALCAAYYAILQAAIGIFDYAAYSVIAAMIFDSLDGRSARFTNTCTKFGASFDSLTDMLAYGVAPVIMLYCWGLFNLGKLGYFVCFIFCACTALRLARFNVMLGVIDKRYFQGLSSTMAGGVIVTLVLSCVQYQLAGALVWYITAAITLITALLMVSNFKFYSFKEIHASPRLIALALTIILLLLIMLTVKYKALVLFGLLSIYVVINILLQPWFLRKNK